MGSLEIVEMPLQLCAKFNLANCKLLPITNHFCEVPFTKTIILFFKSNIFISTWTDGLHKHI